MFLLYFYFSLWEVRTLNTSIQTPIFFETTFVPTIPPARSAKSKILKIDSKSVVTEREGRPKKERSPIWVPLSRRIRMLALAQF